MLKSDVNTKSMELESIRGLAALLIIVVHIPYPFFESEMQISKNGYLMVQLFFVLSGFVIFNAYDGKINSTQDVMRFQFLRFARLYPVHLLFLLIFLCFEIFKYIATEKYGIKSPNAEPFTHNNLTAFIHQLFLIHAIGPTGTITSFNGPAWSISVEFYTYFIFSLILLMAKNNRIWIFGIIALFSLALLIFEQTYGFTYLFQCLAGFFIGTLTAHFTKKWQLVIPSIFSFVIFLSIIAFLILKTDNRYDSVVFILSSLLILTLTKSNGGLLKLILNFRVLTWLGTISYSLYMSHTAIMWVINSFVRLVLKRPEYIGSYGKPIPQLSEIEILMLYGVIFFLTITISALIYKFVEAPIREKSREVTFTKFASKVIPQHK